jgi:hypothetical protein
MSMQIKSFNLSHDNGHGYFIAPWPAADWLAKMRRGLGKRLPLQLQSESAGSGLSCMGMLAGYHDLPFHREGVPHASVAPFSYLTLAQLIQSAGIMGLHCRPLRIQPSGLLSLKLPALLQTHGAHYVVLKSLRKQRLTMHDPGSGIVVLSLEQVAQRFTGIAIEVEPSGKFCRRGLAGAREWGGLSDHLGDTRITPPRKILSLVGLVLAVIFLTGHFAGG